MRVNRARGLENARKSSQGPGKCVKIFQQNASKGFENRLGPFI